MWIKNIILFIWAYIPFFALTDDLGFLTANPNAAQHEYYLSIISLLFGEKKLQFFSIPIKQPGKGIIWFRIKRLSDMDAFNLTNTKANQLESDKILDLSSNNTNRRIQTVELDMRAEKLIFECIAKQNDLLNW